MLDEAATEEKSFLAQGVVAPAIQPADGNVEDPAVEKYCQGEGLRTTRA